MRGWRHDYHNHMQSVKAYLAMNNLAEVPKTLAVSDIDLCVVIGNLIDNAVEACEKVAPEHQFIRLYIGILQKQLYLSVSNATCETVRKFDEQYISSKRDDNRYLLEFSHVSFRYPGSTQDILKDVSMTFRIGEKLALVGLNGAGKTTLIKLLCRLYEPTAGEIRLNGINIAKYDYEEYIQIFSVVFQDFCLYDFPLEENVASGGVVDSARLQRALELAGFWERIQELPQKEKTLLRHENGQGVLLSGGEAQKVAIARALYKDAPFVILDEPAAALDPFAEAEVYENFNTLVQDKTAVYISHRMSSCKFCDRIVVLDGGRILEEGTHEALLQKKGRYYMLYSTQASYYTH
ncbi:MAG: ATP-binding cassette domain-containing protein [Lachnospiraceae bacterium]